MRDDSQDWTPFMLRNSFSIFIWISLEFMLGIEIIAWVIFSDEVLLDIKNTDIRRMKIIPNMCLKRFLQRILAVF